MTSATIWILTFALLDDNSWCQRAIHEIILRDSDHVHATVSYQVDLPIDLVRQHAVVKPGDWIRLLLPFGMRPNGLLLNVDFSGVSRQPTALLLREKGSKLQAGYLAHISGSQEQPLDGKLWEGISAYTTSTWREYYAREHPNIWQGLSESWRLRLLRIFEFFAADRVKEVKRSWRISALVKYLNEEIDSNIAGNQVTSNDVEVWLERMSAAKTKLEAALGEGPDNESASDCVLLAVPFVPVEFEYVEDIGLLVDEFCEAVEAMDLDIARLVAEYGRRWQVVVDTVVPVGRLCSIKMTDQRPWITAPSKLLKQQLVFGEAATTHVEIRTADPGVEIYKPRVQDVGGEKSGPDLVHERRDTPDAITFYAAKPAPSEGDFLGPLDPERTRTIVNVAVRARASRGQQLLFLWLFLLIVAGGIAILLLPEGIQLVGSLTLLIFPLTLAGVVVLTREATSLAERLLRWWRILLVLAVTLIWILTLVRLLGMPDVTDTELDSDSIAQLVQKI